jgi:hypothetical protein
MLSECENLKCVLPHISFESVAVLKLCRRSFVSTKTRVGVLYRMFQNELYDCNLHYLISQRSYNI